MAARHVLEGVEEEDETREEATQSRVFIDSD